MTHPAILNPDIPCKYGHIGDRYPTGLCRVCARDRAKQWALDNPDKVKYRIRKTVKRPKILDPLRPCSRGHVGERYPNGRCRACIVSRVKEWKFNNQDRVKLSNNKSAKRVRLLDPEKAREKSRRDQRRRYVQVPEIINAAAKRWRKNNPEKYRESLSRWRREHPGLRAAEVAARRARKKNATPAWVDMQMIKEVYKRAKRVGKCLGVKVNVDHIVPLQSNLVCGLHVLWNLQILAAEVNVKKSNKVWPDMTPWS